MTKINIVQIQNALQIPITAGFVTDTLNVAPVETVKRAVYWAASDYSTICHRLIGHITNLSTVNAAEISGERPKKAQAEPEPVQPDFFEADTTDDFFA